QQVRINRQQRAVVSRDARAGRREVGRASRELALTNISTDSGVDECVVNRRIDHATVVDAPAATKTHLAVATQVVSKAYAWSKVVAIVDLIVRLRQGRIRINRVRIALVFVTQSEVQGKPRRHAPIVLNEVIQIRGLHIQAQHAETLVEVAGVALADSPRGTHTQSE